MKKVTITDIAQLADVSVSAVSRYINNSGSVSAAKREAIKKAIDESGYSFVKNIRVDNNVIGLLCSDLRDSIFHQKLLASLIHVADQMGKKIMVFSDTRVITNRSLPDQIRSVMQSALEGLIIAGFNDARMSNENVQLLRSLSIPVILMERTGMCRQLSSITFDNRAAMFEMVEYLQRIGHRDIGYIGCKAQTEVEVERNEGFVEALREYDLTLDNRRVVLQADYGVRLGMLAMEKILKSDCGVTAVITGADSFAVGAIHAIREHGLHVPEDVSVIGMDDLYGELTFPSLSSMSFPLDRAAMSALSFFAERNQKKDDTPIHISFVPQIMQRESVQPL